MGLRICEVGLGERNIGGGVASILDGAAARRASALAERMVALLSRQDGVAECADSLRSFCQASATIERLLVGGGNREVRLGTFLDRLVTLRGMWWGRGEVRTSVVEVPVEFDLARGVWFAMSELFEVAEHLGSEEVLLAVEAEGDCLFVAFAIVGAADAPVVDMAGSHAMLRLRELVASLGGGVSRGTRDNMMIFGVTFPVRDGNPR